MPTPIQVTVHNDPGCPWSYSGAPPLRVLEWRYRDQLDWRLVLIGLTEVAQQYVDRGYTPLSMSRGYVSFKRFGMPFSTTPRERVVSTARACRAIAAARQLEPGSEWTVFRHLQLAWFTTQLLLDEDAAIHAALEDAPGVNADAIVALLDDEEVVSAYRRDWTEARTAAGSPAELQGKTAQTDGEVRFTAPSIIAEGHGRRVVAGGFQPVEAYDLAITNVDPSLER
ncbi:MAG: DsbA family protein, partial [Gaiellales bacterium]